MDFYRKPHMLGLAGNAGQGRIVGRKAGIFRGNHRRLHFSGNLELVLGMSVLVGPRGQFVLRSRLEHSDRSDPPVGNLQLPCEVLLPSHLSPSEENAGYDKGDQDRGHHQDDRKESFRTRDGLGSGQRMRWWCGGHCSRGES